MRFTSRGYQALEKIFFVLHIAKHSSILSMPIIFLKIFPVIVLIRCARNPLVISICVSESLYGLNARQRKKNKHQSYWLNNISSYPYWKGLHFLQFLLCINIMYMYIYKYDLNLNYLLYFSYTWKIPFTFTTKTDSNFNQTANDVIWLDGKEIGMAL